MHPWAGQPVLCWFTPATYTSHNIAAFIIWGCSFSDCIGTTTGSARQSFCFVPVCESPVPPSRAPAPQAIREHFPSYPTIASFSITCFPALADLQCVTTMPFYTSVIPHPIMLGISALFRNTPGRKGSSLIPIAWSMLESTEAWLA